MGVPLLITKNLTVGYGQRLLFGSLSLCLRSKAFVCLIGANGAGKSTLLKTLAGLQKPLAGRVFFREQNLHQLPPEQRAKHLSMVLTDRLELDWLSVEELVSLGRHPYTDWQGRLGAGDRDIVRRAIAAVGLTELRQKSITQISDGERQKAMIARALAQQTELMILDEPTAYLDLPRRVEVMQLLRSLAHTENRSVLMSTHDLDLALRSADQLWLVTASRDLVMGTPEELVLQGALGATFGSDRFEFDRVSGQFQLNYQRRSPIQLQGEGLVTTWTARALTRLGYEITTEATDLVLEVRSNPDLWILNCGDRPLKFQSLGELSTHLQAYNMNTVDQSGHGRH
ncbi:ABC transporter ATP-binding protein [[Limnothrix rosea] IAM M-220]|uniref:ABC transporter ATP-binding protein n=1 Tax=[Limnothrix rosea] IAM M-220 TaxID=454133 RepID=UPI00095EC332|nr:ABC transporter ATP-binding protein [[Limnothrix rosea] IAM M-220]OKH15238.1 ATP-binding protein [[Limnothrix rosea] IAM M-220]